MSHEVTEAVIRHPLVDFVNFTGSVKGGRRVHEAAGSKFMGMSY